MAKYIFFIFLLSLISCSSVVKPELQLSSKKFNFGNLERDSIYEGSIIITNLGKTSLIIESINPDCGCTYAKVTKDTILSKDTCMLTFAYNTRRKKGLQENFITIIANTDSIIHMVEINAYVN